MSSSSQQKVAELLHTEGQFELKGPYPRLGQLALSISLEHGLPISRLLPRFLPIFQQLSTQHRWLFV